MVLYEHLFSLASVLKNLISKEPARATLGSKSVIPFLWHKIHMIMPPMTVNGLQVHATHVLGLRSLLYYKFCQCVVICVIIVPKQLMNHPKIHYLMRCGAKSRRDRCGAISRWESHFAYHPLHAHGCCVIRRIHNCVVRDKIWCKTTDWVVGDPLTWLKGLL